MDDIIKQRRIQTYTNGKRIVNKLENRRISVFRNDDTDLISFEFKRLLDEKERKTVTDELVQAHREDAINLDNSILTIQLGLTKDAAKVLIDTLMHLVYPEVMEK